MPGFLRKLLDGRAGCRRRGLRGEAAGPGARQRRLRGWRVRAGPADCGALADEIGVCVAADGSNALWAEIGSGCGRSRPSRNTRTNVVIEAGLVRRVMVYESAGLSGHRPLSGKAATMSRRAKIVCTLGPASSSQEQVAGLVAAGLDVARLNMSHGTPADHLRAYQ